MIGCRRNEDMSFRLEEEAILRSEAEVRVSPLALEAVTLTL